MCHDMHTYSGAVCGCKSTPAVAVTLKAFVRSSENKSQLFLDVYMLELIAWTIAKPFLFLAVPAPKPQSFTYRVTCKAW